MMADKIDQPWLHRTSLQSLLEVLSRGNGEARIAGGAVRNALLGQPIADVDIATNLVPRDVILRSNEAGYKCVPTGIEHGTVTVIVDGEPYEVTTLRRDIETDGRHAKVLYGTDWEADARRRDLTINALYLDADGTVFDPLAGMADILSHTVRFIDDAETRIREDYLRILRFFRFFAWYGSFRPDAEGLKACTRLKDGLEELSVERIWQELSVLFAAPDPGRAVLWMRQTGVLSKVLPETERWGIDALPGYIETEHQNGWDADSLMRLLAILPPNRDRLLSLADRLKLSKKVRNRLTDWAGAPEPDPTLKQDPFYRWLYWQNISAVEDRLRLAVGRSDDNARKFLRQLKWLRRWQKPKFPLQGRDLLKLGMEPGPAIKQALARLEQIWVDSGFSAGRDKLLSHI
jgi:tRNA nucleotidyltransferase/poly(A) polymerase